MKRIKNSELRIKNVIASVVIIISFIILNSTFITPVHAQAQGVSLTTLYPIADPKAIDGDILITSSKGLVRANVSYSSKMFGILQTTPLMVYTTPDLKGKPVIRDGVAEVNVTNEGGTIKAGDYISSSPTAGKGQKIIQSAYILGVALEDMHGKSDKIRVAINIQYAELTNTKSVLRLLDAFNIAAFQTVKDPERASQFVSYTGAALVIIASLILSFAIFARSITKSIEAIGRNPLAKNAIQLSILINAGLTILTILIGVGAAILILRL